MDRDWKIGLGFSAALLVLAFATGEPVQAQELNPTLTPLIAPNETMDRVGDNITEKTGARCERPVVFTYGTDWVVTCANAPTVWTVTATGELYQNGDLRAAFERNFR